MDMFVRGKKNKSGTISVQIIDKSSGSYRVIKTVGSSSDPNEIAYLRKKAYTIIPTLIGQTSIDFWSDSTTDSTRYWYPKEYNSIVSKPLLSRHIIAVPMMENYYKNGNLVSGKVTRYNNLGNPCQIYLLETDKPLSAPTHNQDQLVPSGYLKRADLTYDGNNLNLISIQKSDDNKTSYIWGYDNDKPIAEINNSVTNGYYFNVSSI